MNTSERKPGNIEPELTEDEKARLAELKATEKVARLGGGVCNPFTCDEKKQDPNIDDVA